jgi:hypothetical protein
MICFAYLLSKARREGGGMLTRQERPVAQGASMRRGHAHLAFLGATPGPSPSTSPDPEDVSDEIQDGALTISAEREREQTAEDGQYYARQLSRNQPAPSTRAE